MNETERMLDELNYKVPPNADHLIFYILTDLNDRLKVLEEPNAKGEGEGKSEIILEGIDFEFIDKFMEDLKIQQGTGIKNILAIFMHKLHEKSKIRGMLE